MSTKIMKIICVLALLLAASWRAPAGPKILLDIVVCVGAMMVATQAVTRRKYLWATGFVAIVALFNPVLPVALSPKTFLWLDLVCLMTFLVSLAALKRQPILSIPSITNRTPGSESL